MWLGHEYFKGQMGYWQRNTENILRTTSVEPPSDPLSELGSSTLLQHIATGLAQPVPGRIEKRLTRAFGFLANWANPLQILVTLALTLFAMMVTDPQLMADCREPLSCIGNIAGPLWSSITAN
jgi:hypothetical protein